MDLSRRRDLRGRGAGVSPRLLVRVHRLNLWWTFTSQIRNPGHTTDRDFICKGLCKSRFGETMRLYVVVGICFLFFILCSLLFADWWLSPAEVEAQEALSLIHI